MSPRNVLALALAGGVLAGCSSSGGSGGSPGPDGSTGPDGASPPDAAPLADSSAPIDSGAATDSGSAEDGPSGDAGPTTCSGSDIDGGGLAYAGIVELSRVTLPAPARYGALVQIEPSASYPTGSCTGTLVGACCYESEASADASVPVFESAGTITVADGTSTIATLMYPNYAASSTTDATLTWAAGAMLTVTAAGATVGPFTATVPAPVALAGVTPPFSAPIAVKKSSDLVVTWTPGKRACSKVSFDLSQGGVATMPHIGCVVDDVAGTVTVPASLLGMFAASTGTAVIERVEGTRTLASNAEIGLAAVNVQRATTSYVP
jgi:hypothetical protein